MRQQIGCVALLVRDYDEAKRFYTEALRFRVVEDTDMGMGRRWVVLEPPGPPGCRLLLAKAKNEQEAAAVGRQAGGRVFLFLHTDDFARDHGEMKARGVRFNEEPREEKYGTVAVFEDLYGNRWDLLMPRKAGLGWPAGAKSRDGACPGASTGLSFPQVPGLSQAPMNPDLPHDKRPCRLP